MSSISGDELLRQVRIARALAECAKVITTGELTEFEKPLRSLLDAADLHVIGINRNFEDPERGLCAEGLVWVDRDVADPQHLGIVSWAEVPYTRSVLEAGGLHQMREPSELPEPDRSLVLSSPAAIRSLVEVPIFLSDVWAGSVLFGTHTVRTIGSDDDVALLRSLADLVSARWSKDAAIATAREALAERDRSLQLRQALVDCSRVLLESDVDDPLSVAVAAVRRAMGGQGLFVDRHLPDAEGGPGFETVSVSSVLQDSGIPWQPTVSHWKKWQRALGVLSKGEPFSFESLSELSDGELEFVSHYQLPVESELDYPIMIDGRFSGAVAIGDAAPRHWTALERETLRVVASMIGSYWRLEEARKRLEESLRAKDAFIASVSHELRTPLSVVVGMAAVIRDRHAVLTAEEMDEFTALAAGQAIEVADLVEDLLIAARSDDALFTVIPSAVELGSLVEEVVAALPGHVASSVSVLGSDAVVVSADPLRTRQIVRNLIMNAYRHGGPDIIVSAGLDRAMGTVEVTDNGGGIPEALRKSVFDRFVSGAERDGRTGSIGLGLTVSRTLADLMDGTVELKPTDSGTTFVVSLPLTS